MKYPTYIEVPEGYWTFSTTVNVEEDEDKKNIHWHHNEED